MAGSRVAQHYVQVVGNPDVSGEVRVRRLYVEVLLKPSGITIHNETVNQALGITDAAIGRVETQEASNTLNFSQQINLTFEKTVNQIMLLTSQAGEAKDGVATSNLNLTQLMVYFNYVGDRTPVEHTLNLTQCVVTLQTLVAEHDLGLTDSVDYDYPTKPTVTQFMGLYQHVSTPHREFVTHNLALTDLGRVPIEHTLTSNLALTDVADMTFATHTLAFTQTAAHGFGLWVAHDLGIADEMERVGEWIRSVSHDMALNQYLTWYEDSPCARKQYTPFQGEGSGTPPQTLQDPQGSVSDRFSVYQPALGVRSSEVILRAPEMDNRDRNAYNRVQGETRGGKLRVYADPIWPKVRTLAVTITGLTETQIDDLHTFMAATLGQTIGLTDWEGRLWEGIITTPDEVATQDGKGRWTVSFEFEGEMLTTEQPGNDDGNGMAMNLSQSVTAVIV
jgi:hypothetical protein